MNNRFYINPDSDILTNLYGFVGNFAVQNICARFSPFKAAQDFVVSGHFDYNDMLAFEDVTWDTVFAKMKTVEFSNSKSESDAEINDMEFYMDFADMIHDIDADALVKQFGEASIEVSGYICLDIINEIKRQIIPLIQEETDLKAIIIDLKSKIAPIIIKSIKKYCSSGTEDIDDELRTLFDQTQSVFEKIEYDETAYFKVMYASMVKGTEVLICNPEYLQLGDRIKSAIKYYASGASVAIGDKFSAQLKPEQYEKLEKIAPGLVDYIPQLISMIVTCAIVITVDKNPLMITLTDEFNKVPTITGNIALFRENAEAFEKMAAELAKIDLEELKSIIDGYDHLVNNLESVSDPSELNKMLISYYRDNNKVLPWGDRSLQEHWADKNSRLVFK